MAIVDIATVAVPAGLVGARIYRIAVDYRLYFGHGHDWVGVARIWDGGLGLPGAAVGGLAAAYLWCRAQHLALGPVLAAAAPAVSIGAAISMLGNWFDQGTYGPPSGLPWAVPIAPASRLPGYQDFGTFQPLFLYETLWNIARRSRPDLHHQAAQRDGRPRVRRLRCWLCRSACLAWNPSS